MLRAVRERITFYTGGWQHGKSDTFEQTDNSQGAKQTLTNMHEKQKLCIQSVKWQLGSDRPNNVLVCPPPPPSNTCPLKLLLSLFMALGMIVED